MHLRIESVSKLGPVKFTVFQDYVSADSMTRTERETLTGNIVRHNMPRKSSPRLSMLTACRA